ncbi:MAG: NlpC/P60 family protein, partial [Sporichthyaceae bacterium]|nr:NlpC/P60 family protein [Sporichthyaceae bacterium]
SVRRHHRRTIAGLCLAATAVIVAVPSAGHAEPTNITDAQQEIQNLYHEAELATERYNDYRERIKEAERRLDVTQAAIAAHQAKIEEQLRESGIYAAIAYQTGGVDQTLQLLLSDSPQQFLQRASVLDQLTKKQAQGLRGVEQVRQQLLATRLMASQQIAEISGLRADLVEQRDSIEFKLRRAQSLLNRLEADQRDFLASTGSLKVPKSVMDNLPGGRAGDAIRFAIDQIGEPYVWGANGPSSWDCSSLTQQAWASAGVAIPRVSWKQATVGSPVSKANLKAGDLVFFYSPISHVGIYIGEGLMIHAPNPSTVVKVQQIDTMPFTTARRVG